VVWWWVFGVWDPVRDVVVVVFRWYRPRSAW